MAQVNLSDYKKLYLQTAKEYVGNLSSGYSKLSANPADTEAINTIHISSHSLKSQSQVMGFTNIADLSANLEKNSDDILNGISKINGEFMINLKDSIDRLNLEISSIEKGNIA